MSDRRDTVAHMFDVLELTAVDPHGDESVFIARIAELERVKSAAVAGQARATAALDARRRAAESAAGVPRGKQCRGVAGEVALARRDSPYRGNQHLGFAKALVYEMPHTLAALEAGFAFGVAGDVDRAGVGVSGRRGSSRVGCGVVFGRRRVGGFGRRAHHR